MFFDETGTGMFVPGVPAQFDLTYTGTPDGSWAVTDNSTPCLEGPPGCNLGSFIFQPPRITLPAGTTEECCAVFLWEFSYNIPIVPAQNPFQTEVVTFNVHSSAGDYSFSEPLGLDPSPPFVAFHSDPYDAPVKAALASNEQASPLVVDILVSTFEPLPPRGPAPDGAVINFHYDFTLSGVANPPDLSFPYELPSVPEPSTGVLFLVGVALIARTRTRLVWRHRFIGPRLAAASRFAVRARGA